MKHLVLLLFAFIVIGVNAQETPAIAATGSNSGDGEITAIVTQLDANDVTLRTGITSNTTLAGTNHALNKQQTDIVELFTLNVGWGNTSEDSIYFIAGYFYDGEYNSADTLYVTQLTCAVAIGDELSGATTVSVDLDWDVNMNDATPTQLNSSPLVVASTTTGTIDAAFDNAVISPATWVWWRVATTEGRIPSKLVCTASGYVAD